ncbi:MAG: hypothetical protein ACMG57_02230 [Candidatus Dojkabacteria bacterium]
MIFSLDTSKPFSEVQTLTWTEEEGLKSPKAIIFEDPQNQAVYQIIEDSIGNKTKEIVEMMSINESTFDRVISNFEEFLNDTLNGMFPPFYILREELKIELEEKGLEDNVSILNYFDTITDVIRLSQTSLEFSNGYYYLITEFYLFATKELPTFSQNSLSKFVIASEIKKKVLERLESQDK